MIGGIFWQARQQQQISSAEMAATQAQSKADQTKQTIRQLEDRIDALQLKCQAMWEILRHVADITDHDIEAKILEIDGRDGVQDGKMTATVRQCIACSRPVGRRHSYCLYCGQPMNNKEVFE